MFFENILCKKKNLNRKKKDRKRERQEKRWTSYENVRETLFLSRASFLIGQIKFILMYRHFHQQGFFFSVEKFPSVENWQYKNNFNCLIKIKLYNSKIFFSSILSHIPGLSLRKQHDEIKIVERSAKLNPRCRKLNERNRHWGKRGNIFLLAV